MQSEQYQPDQAEQAHFKEVIASFFNYKFDSWRDVIRLETNFDKVKSQNKLLKYPLQLRLDSLKKAIEMNAQFLYQIVDEHKGLFNFKTDPQGNVQIHPMLVEENNKSKLKSLLKQFVREWSKEGHEERETAFKPIREALEKHFPDPKKVRVLFPGCGLGRILVDFAKLGYGVQGNEVSYYMLTPALHMLNSVIPKESLQLQPYIHTYTNHLSFNEQYRVYQVPDVCPSEMITEEHDFSMAAGEFCEVYKELPEVFDSVVTCFFIDTAKNILDYIETIYVTLKEGGVWVNMGPLLYHFADMEGQSSIELSWEELQFAIKEVGFDILEQKMIESTYTNHQNALMKTVYNCIFFTAVKRQV